MMVEGKLYPSLNRISSIMVGNPRKKIQSMLEFLDLDRIGDRDSNLTQQDLNKGQANWNYGVMNLQGKKTNAENWWKRKRKSRKKYKKKLEKAGNVKKEDAQEKKNRR